MIKFLGDQLREREREGESRRYSPYCSLHLANVSHSFVAGQSNKFPMRGSGFGPGGKRTAGDGESHRLSKYRASAARGTSRAMRAEGMIGAASKKEA